ncbi:MAG: helix-turn-helix domain-containing protein [Oscillospiraceae bacterium]|nr:helix-turn-helix domain-containing protein [Oscillospiraceae bacterium]
MQSIKEIRQSTGLSRQKFGDALNIPRRTLEDWEQGLRKCPEYVAELIAYRVANDPTIPKVKEADE